MSIFLLINSIGYSVYAHYCNDELKETSLLVNTNKSCCAIESTEHEAESAEAMSCCEEQDVLIKIEDQFVKSELNFQAIVLPVLHLSVSFVNEMNIALFANVESYFLSNFYDPPDRTLPNLHVLLCIFRI
jgi:hypothetical protein